MTTRDPRRKRFGNLDEVKSFLNFVRKSTEGARPGMTVIMVNLVELELTIDLRIGRIDVFEEVQKIAKRRELTVFRLLDRAMVVVPPQDQSHRMAVIHDVRMAVVQTVSARASELGLDPSKFTEVLHTYRDAQLLRERAGEITGSPKLLAQPITKAATLAEEHLEEFQRRIKSVGPDRFIDGFGRYQAIARIGTDGQPKTSGWELFVAVREINRILFPNADVVADEMFDQLMTMMDQTVMAALLARDVPDGHISMNLNISTIASDEFLTFAKYLSDDAVRRQEGAELWAELRADDLLEHFETFRDVEAALRKHNMYFMADHITRHNIKSVIDSNLPVNGYKVLFDNQDSDYFQIAEDVDRLAQQGAIVMARIDSPEGLDFARFHGARRVQGYLIDNRLKSGEEYAHEPDP
jgi:EAL domain-containing protein (putative c-di-GMP-specific phosphodiesterase class I)